MKSINWKKALPHLIAILVFLIVALIYCHQALSGEVLQQSDILHWKGMAQDAFNYKAIHGHFPLWNTHLFSGMPNYQVAMDGHSFLPDFNKILTLWLPKPISFFFLACVCFYILTQTVRLKPLIGVMVSLAFAYATYTPVIIVAGHESKMMAMAYMPALLAGLILLYEKRYALGTIVATLFATLEIGANHPQVTYYLLICMALLTIAYIIYWIKEGQLKHGIIALSLAVLAGLIGLGNAAMGIFPTYQYAKYTIRGGSTIDVSSGTPKEVQKTSGLEESYAFQYSLGKAETFELAMPNAFGGSSGNMFDENSEVYSGAMQLGQQLNGKLPPQQLNSVMNSVVSKYWGGIVPFTSGPIYAGTLIVLLAIIGWVVVPSRHKWWILAATLLTIMMAWGNYFEGFNQFLFDYLPLYNKFRAPSMAMIIPQLLLPLMAGIALQKLFFNKEGAAYIQKNFKKILYATGGFVVLLLLIYLANDYSLNNPALSEFLRQPQINGSSLISTIEDARKSMFFAGIERVVLFAALLLAGLFLYVRKILSPVVILGALLLISTIDLLKVDSKYLGTENYMEPEELQSAAFTESAADKAIYQDKDPHFRVLNLASGDPFTDAMTSYRHRSLGGYHAAKLINYQNMIAAHMTGQISQSIIDMLDARYIIAPGQGQGQLAVQRNPGALGAAWFVKHIQPVKNEVAAIKAIGQFDPTDTAFVQQSHMESAGAAPVFDSTATIKLTKYGNDTIQYQTEAKSPQFAVLSEIYYPAGWNAYIDGKKTDYVEADYVLRGIAVPAGNHEITFRFEPAVVQYSQTAGYVSNTLFWLSMCFSIFFLWRKEEKNKLNKAKEA
ncbi:MAG TPA: YfhO family protein [Arachidicoccus sp.]|nr:YfhO family protein [Arachidicoccus sp.]